MRRCTDRVGHGRACCETLGAYASARRGLAAIATRMMISTTVPPGDAPPPMADAVRPEAVESPIGGDGGGGEGAGLPPVVVAALPVELPVEVEAPVLVVAALPPVLVVALLDEVVVPALVVDPLPPDVVAPLPPDVVPPPLPDVVEAAPPPVEVVSLPPVVEAAPPVEVVSLLPVVEAAPPEVAALPAALPPVVVAAPPAVVVPALVAALPVEVVPVEVVVPELVQTLPKSSVPERSCHGGFSNAEAMVEPMEGMLARSAPQYSMLTSVAQISSVWETTSASMLPDLPMHARDMRVLDAGSLGASRLFCVVVAHKLRPILMFTEAPVTPSMGMAMAAAVPPASTSFEIVTVTAEDVADSVTPSTAEMEVWIPEGKSAGRVIEPSMDADAGEPQGRTDAPRAMVMAGVLTALETYGTAATTVTLGSVSGHEEVPPMPELAVLQEQPSAEGNTGLRTSQTGPDAEDETVVHVTKIRSMADADFMARVV